MFRSDAAPTRANLLKRLRAADEALQSAFEMADRGPDKNNANLSKAISNAIAWNRAARDQVIIAKGKRS